MARKHRIPESIWATALEQDGVFSHRQVAALGLTRNVIQRALDDRLWWQVTRGLYSFSPSPTWRGLAWGGVLLGGPDAVLGLQTAGHLYGWCEQPELIDVLVPRRAKDRSHWRFHLTLAASRGTLPCALPEPTALALCSEATPGDVLGILSEAVYSKRTTAERLRTAARNSPNLRHRSLILSVLGDVEQGVTSALEERFRTVVELAHGLPAPVRQGSISSGTVTDALFEEHKVAVELDGRLGHTGKDAFRDLRRDNRHTVAGWVTLRYGWHDVVDRPCEVAAQIVEVLQTRGWQGTVRRCGSCPKAGRQSIGRSAA